MVLLESHMSVVYDTVTNEEEPRHAPEKGRQKSLAAKIANYLENVHHHFPKIHGHCINKVLKKNP